MTSSELQCEVCVVHFKWIKGESRWIRVVLQWLGRNSMAPINGCPWWCPIYI